MEQQTVTLIVSGMGILGTLSAAFGVHVLTRGWQREQWARDKRIQDYQDVLSATTSAYLAVLRIRTIRGDEVLARVAGTGPTHHLDAIRELEDTKADSYRVIRDRIFIAKELEYADILMQWDTAVINFERSGDSRLFAERFTALNGKLVAMALNSPPVAAAMME